MASIPKRVEARLVAGIKKFQPVLAMARSKDVNESDTVVILNDLISEVFGYDKYFEVTSEFSIRNTYCDIAIKLDGKPIVLLEAKAAGIELKDPHIKQAVDYAANQGVDWVVLTNGIDWRIYKVIFAKPIDNELVCAFDFCSLDPKDDNHLQFLYLLTKEGWAKSAVGEFHLQKQALNRFYVGAAMLTDSVVNAVRRELKRVSPDVRIDAEQIQNVIAQEVIKREVTEGEKFMEARKALGRAAIKVAKSKKDSVRTATLVAGTTATAPTDNQSSSSTGAPAV
jgi:hypothetical protein